ncbi:MAG: dUTP diphosphatase [Nanoarchaeota archaeon]|nr:dUTP diphosphatase [Nanoarchaeota archaeon]
MLKVKIKKISQEAKIPEYAHEGDAGMDVYAISKTENENFVEYGTGLAFEVPKGYVMLIFPRSSVTKKDLMLKNSVGVLDSGYRGELVLRFRKLGENDYEIGERVGQIMIIPFPEIEFEESESLEDSSRGEAGWGSTGTN